MIIDELFDAAKADAGDVDITIRRPDDWHVHLRDGAMLKAVLPYTARQFARAIRPWPAPNPVRSHPALPV